MQRKVDSGQGVWSVVFAECGSWVSGSGGGLSGAMRGEGRSHRRGRGAGSQTHNCALQAVSVKTAGSRRRACAEGLRAVPKCTKE